MKSLSGLAYKSSERPDAATYDLVAAEYYDEQLHPTCADFRAGCRAYLESFFEKHKPVGRMADIGCGKSLVADFRKQDLVLVDESPEMLGHNPASLEMRCIDVERVPIGTSEFDWIFAILGDPYNSPAAWKNIQTALKPAGQCIFIVPSDHWAKVFRENCSEERADLARFLTSRGEIFLRSLIVEPACQEQMILDTGMSLVATDHVLVADLPYIRSPKISEFLLKDQSLLDIYQAKKP